MLIARLMSLVATLVLLASCSSAPESSSPTAAPATPAAAPVASDTPSPDALASAAGTESTPTATARDLADLELALAPVVQLDAPIAMATRQGDEDALYIAERAGRVVRVVDGVVDGDAVLDISDQTTTGGERGLLGIDFSDDGDRLYVSYTDLDGNSRLDEYTMQDMQAGDQRTLLEVTQPYSNHNGGNVVTGPDGLLYYGLGDGGAGGDPQGNGQDRSTLLGALLRIDPRAGGDAAYQIPPDNPFVGSDDSRPEIWIYGLRNPWRFSFDRQNNDVWIADVGQNAVEEIDWLPFDQAGGTNLGWNAFEGTHRFSEAEAPDAVPPVYEYPNDGSHCAVTGGYVYRGADIHGLDGAYLFADFCDGVLHGLRLDGDTVAEERAFGVQVPELVSFGQDAHGELYVLSLSGEVSRLTSER